MNSKQIVELTTKAVEELASALEAGRSEALTQYLAAISRFHKYSLHNVMLIVLQKPDASHVAGFHTWRKLGRYVRKGEKGINIFAPILRRKRIAESKAQEELEEIVHGYRACSVRCEPDGGQTIARNRKSAGRRPPLWREADRLHAFARHQARIFPSNRASTGRFGRRQDYSATGLRFSGTCGGTRSRTSSRAPPPPTASGGDLEGSPRDRGRGARRLPGPRPLNWDRLHRLHPVIAETRTSCSKASITSAWQQRGFSKEF